MRKTILNMSLRAKVTPVLFWPVPVKSIDKLHTFLIYKLIFDNITFFNCYNI